MAHLPIREKEGKIDITDAIQQCVKRARWYRIAATGMQVITALGGVTILALLSFLTAPTVQSVSGQSPTIQLIVNTTVANAIRTIAIAISIVSAIESVFTPGRMSDKYGTALRALRRLRDKYEAELSRSPNETGWAKQLEVWGKNHAYEIERLFEDSKVVDINLHFKISDPLPPSLPGQVKETER